MLCVEFINKAKELTIQQLDNGYWYLEPEWNLILHENELFYDDISDFEFTSKEMKDILKLEVEKRNLRDSKTKDVIDWLYDLITATVEPAIMQEETDYIKQVVEFMKENYAKDQVREE